MLFFCLLLLAGPVEKEIYLESALQLQTDTADVFLSQVKDICVDSRGRIYALDPSTHTVYMWTKDGTFVKQFGKRGEGPGEFLFRSNFGGFQGFLSTVEDRLYVLDPATKKLNQFDADQRFVSAKPFKVQTGKIALFRILKDGGYLVQARTFFTEVPTTELIRFNADLSKKTTLFSLKDISWAYADGKTRGIFAAFCPTLAATYNETTGIIAAGYSDQPSFNRFNSAGEKQAEVTAKLKRLPVTEADRTEYRDDPTFAKQDFFTATYPDYMPYYDRILAVGPDHYLVALESTTDGRYRGKLVTKTGDTVGTVSFNCGDGGSLFSYAGRLFAYITLGEDPTIHELKLSDKPGSLASAE